MIRAKFTSRVAAIALLGLCSSAYAVEFEVPPPKGILEWAAVAVGLFFFGWGIREFVGWMRRRARKEQDAGEDDSPES